MNFKYHSCLFLLLFFFGTGKLLAGNIDSLKNKTCLGVIAKVDYTSVIMHAYSPYDRVELSTKPLRAGLFFHHKKFEFDLSVNNYSFDVHFRLNRENDFFAEATYQIENTDGSTSANSRGDYWNYGENTSPLHLITLSYGRNFYLWQRFRVSPILSIQYYGLGKQDNQFTDFTSYYENKKILIRQQSETNSSLAFGGMLTIESIPNFRRNVKRYCSFFASLGAYYIPQMNFKRSVTIDEWVEGNTVYHESTAKYKYHAETVHFILGMKLWLWNK
jgi:hypothetical protein